MTITQTDGMTRQAVVDFEVTAAPLPVPTPIPPLTNVQPEHDRITSLVATDPQVAVPPKATPAEATALAMRFKDVLIAFVTFSVRFATALFAAEKALIAQTATTTHPIVKTPPIPVGHRIPARAQALITSRRTIDKFSR